MLSFDSGLTNALKNANTTAFWVLKLYYNDESSFIGVSDRHRHDGSDIYYGLVASWGTYRQSLDFFNFTTSIGNLNVTLINSDKSIQGKRFSDLLSDNNFANRKWELFLNTNETSTLDTSDRMIATGIISGEVSYDENDLTLTLFDYTPKYHKRVPINTVDSTYTNAPSKNLGKPIPIAYGDFYEKTDIGTIPTTNFDRLKQFYKGAFPAIVTDEWDVQEEGSEAKVDSQAIHTMDDENVYVYKNGYYPSLTAANVDVTGNPEIEYKGSTASVYFPISISNLASESGTGSYSVSDEERTGDGDFSDYTTWLANGASSNNSVATMTFALPKVNKLGIYSGVYALVKWGTVSDLSGEDSDVFRFTANAANVDLDSISSNSETKTSIGSLYSGKTDAWDFEGSLQYSLRSGTANESAQIYESGIQVDFTIENVEPHEVQELYEGGPITMTLTHNMGPDEVIQMGYDHNLYSRTVTALTPSEIDYVYCSGKGRKYGSWIDTINSDTRDNQNGSAKDPGYGTSDFIENPIYIIESILRSELSLDASTTGADIDVSTFDYSGNTTDGYLGDIYEDAVGDVKFAFSQYKFINSKDLIERLARMCFSYVFISGNGKFKVKTLRRTDDYSSADQTIDFGDIEIGNVGKSSLGNVKNSIIVNYNHDYGAKQNVSEATATDSVSAGNTVSGYSRNPSSGSASYTKLEMEANEVLDSTTATKLAEAYLEVMKDRHDTVQFVCMRPKYNHLEIGDIINFSNWPTELKIYGQTMGGSWSSTTDTFSSVSTTWANMAAGYFIVADISKTVTGCSIKAIKVS